ncbi:MAG: BMP family lipoprotein [Solirubrobacterales bacterium]
MRPRSWKSIAIWLAVAALTVGAAGCGGDDDGSAEGEEAVSVALVLPCATNDPWCKQGDEGANAVAAKGGVDLEVTTNAPQDTAGVTRVLAQYAQADTELILAHSNWEDAAIDVADQFPDANLATYGVKTHESIAVLEEPIYEAAYLAGMIAGGITETNVIGGSAGEDIPLCHAELEAFAKGAKRVNDDVRMLDNYLGEWNDPALGKQTTESQIDQNADVVIACGGGPATGMAQAIKEADISGFGYVGDMSSLAPENLVGSVLYNLEPYFEAVIEDVRNDTFRPAKRYEFGLADGGVDLKLNDRYSVKEVPDDVLEEVEQVKEEINSGEFEVPFVAEG